jgi:hypothetical protein
MPVRINRVDGRLVPAGLDATVIRRRVIARLFPELREVIERVDRTRAAWSARDVDRTEREMTALGRAVDRYIEAVER